MAPGLVASSRSSNAETVAITSVGRVRWTTPICMLENGNLCMSQLRPSAPTIVVSWLSPGVLGWTPDSRAAFQLTPVWMAPVSSRAVSG
jgi:hypothetical protein